MHWEEASEAARRHTMQRTAPMTENDLEQNVNRALVKKPSFILIV